MSVEARPRLGQLAQYINGSSSLTERGRLMRELILKHSMLKNHKNPNIQFAISPELSIIYSKRIEDLCGQLGLPEEGKARANSIEGYKGKLKQMGYPHWRVS